MLCEFGEQCASADCHAGCPADCPAHLANSSTCPSGPSWNGTVTECSARGACLEQTGVCLCATGYAGDACDACAAYYFRLARHGACVLIEGVTASCSDGVMNGNEADIDCGGPNCGPCPTAGFATLNIMAIAGSIVGGLLLVAGLVYSCSRLKAHNMIMMFHRGSVVPESSHDTLAAKKRSSLVHVQPRLPSSPPVPSAVMKVASPVKPTGPKLKLASHREGRIPKLITGPAKSDKVAPVITGVHAGPEAHGANLVVDWAQHAEPGKGKR